MSIEKDAIIRRLQQELHTFVANARDLGQKHEAMRVEVEAVKLDREHAFHTARQVQARLTALGNLSIAMFEDTGSFLTKPKAHYAESLSALVGVRIG